MKRYVNNIPLGSVLGLFFGFTKIVVEDRKQKDRYIDNAPDTVKWEGLVKDIWKASDEIRYKWLMSKVYEIQPLPDGVMRFVIMTQFEEY